MTIKENIPCWIKTDDLQILRKVRGGVYELAEFTQADEDTFCFSHDKIIVANFKDSNGEWDADAISDIKAYYDSLEEMRACVKAEDEEQIVAEILFEQRSRLDDMEPMTGDQAERYLEDIIKGHITLDF